MAIGKRGVFFTIISIILVSGLLFFYISNNRYSLLEKTKVIEVRAKTMDSFIEDIEHDIEKGLYITSMRSLIGMTEYMAENGTFLTNFSDNFNEIMLNGTIKGKTMNITQNASLGVWIERIIELGGYIDVDVIFDDLHVNVFQDDPWNINVNVEGILNLTDRKDIASWHRSINITTTLNIIEFEDPLYTVNSTGKYSNKIIKTNTTNFIVGNDSLNLIMFANNSWYKSSSSAPSFLMRFAGNLSASPFGIESIVNVNNFETAMGKSYSDVSCVDYIFFGDSSVKNCLIMETKTNLSWLRLDCTGVNHTAIYGVNCDGSCS